MAEFDLEEPAFPNLDITDAPEVPDEPVDTPTAASLASKVAVASETSQENLPVAYGANRGELETRGTSQGLEVLANKINETFTEELKATANLILATDLSEEDKIAAIQELQAASNAGDPKKIIKEFTGEVAESLLNGQLQDGDEDAATVAARIGGGFESLDFLDSEMQRAREEIEIYFGEMEESGFGITLDIIQTIFDPAIEFDTVNMLVSAIPDPELANQVFESGTTVGDKLRAALTVVRENSGDRAFVTTFTDNLVKLMKERSKRLGNDNVLFGILAMSTVVGDPFRDLSNDSKLATVFSALDVMGFAELGIRGPQLAAKAARATATPIARGVDRVGNSVGEVIAESLGTHIVPSTRGTAWEALEQLYPSAAKRGHETLNDTAATLGTSTEAVVQSRALPRAETAADRPTAGPSIGTTQEEVIEEITIDYLAANQVARGLTVADRIHGAGRALKYFGKRLQRAGVELDKSTVRAVAADENGIRLRAMVGLHGNSVGFTDLERMLAYAEEFRESGIKFWYREVKTGVLKEANLDKLREFYTPAKQEVEIRRVVDQVMRPVRRDVEVPVPSDRPVGGVTPKTAARASAILNKIDKVTSKSPKANIESLVQESSKELGRSVETAGKTKKQLLDDLRANKAELEDAVDIDTRGIRSDRPVTETRPEVTIERSTEGTLQPVIKHTDARTEPGIDFFFSVDHEHQFSKADVVKNEELLKTSGLRGIIANYFDPAGTFAQELRNMIAVAVRESSLARRQMQTIIEPLFTMSLRNRSRLMAVLDKGSTDEVWYSKVGLDEALRSLKAEVGQKDLDIIWQGYEATRRLMAVNHQIFNNKLRVELRNDGFRHLIVKGPEGEDADFIAKFITNEKAFRDVRGGALYVYDPKKGSVQKYTRAELDEKLANEGTGLVEARWAQDVESGDGIVRTKYILRTSDDSLADLPEQVLKQRDGYITRIYDTNYLVKKSVANVVDETGTPVDEAEIVAMASNIGDANRYARKQGGAAEGYRVEVAREAEDATIISQSDPKLLNDMGRLFFNKRVDGEILDVSGKRSVSSVFDSIDRASVAASRMITIDSVLEKQKIRIRKTYADVLAPSNLKGAWPLSTKQLTRPKDVSMHRRFDEAVAHINRVNLTAGTTEPFTTRMWRTGMLTIANAISSDGDTTLDLARSAIANRIPTGNRVPTTVMKTVASNMLLSWAPVRQKLLQMQQMTVYAGLDHGLKYFFNRGSDGYLAQATAIRMGLWTKESPAVRAVHDAGLRKTFGMTQQEIDELRLAFSNTGIREDIQGHTYRAIDAVNERSVAATDQNLSGLMIEGRVKQLWQGAKAPTRFLRNIGFNSGELDNQIAAWLTVRNRFIKQNPGKDWKTKESLDFISGQSLSLSGSMNAAGRLEFQQGLLGLMFQFMSFPVKMLQMHPILLAIPGGKNLINKDLARREMWRILGVQTALYGPGLSLGTIVAYDTFVKDSGIIVPPEADMAIREGLIGTGVNLIANAVDIFSGEDADSRVIFSQSFAPTGGIFNPLLDDRGSLNNWMNALIEFFTAEGVDMQTHIGQLLGPSATVVSRLGGLAEVLGYTFNKAYTSDDWTLSKPENADSVHAMLDELISIVPVANDLWRARIAQKTGWVISQSGSKLDKSTYGEAFARMFSIKGAGATAVQDITSDIYDKYGEPSTYEAEVEQIAKFIYERYKTILNRASTGEVPTHILEAEMKALNMARDFSLDPVEAYAVRQIIAKKLMYEDVTQPRGFALPGMLDNVYMKGKLPRTPEEMLAAVKNQPDFEGKDELLQYLEQLTDMKPPFEQLEELEANGR